MKFFKTILPNEKAKVFIAVVRERAFASQKNWAVDKQKQKDFKHQLEEELLIFADPSASQINEIERICCNTIIR